MRVCECCGQPLPTLTADQLKMAIETWIKAKGYTLDEIRGRDRQADLVAIRRYAARFLRENGFSLPQIGKFLNRDHTTVINLIANSPRQPRKLENSA